MMCCDYTLPAKQPRSPRNSSISLRQLTSTDLSLPKPLLQPCYHIQSHQLSNDSSTTKDASFHVNFTIYRSFIVESKREREREYTFFPHFYKFAHAGESKIGSWKVATYTSFSRSYIGIRHLGTHNRIIISIVGMMNIIKLKNGPIKTRPTRPAYATV